MIRHGPTIRAIGEGMAWMVGRRRRIRVAGSSMEPTLSDGEFVLVDTGRRRPAPGRLVVARHPRQRDPATGRRLLVVKRIDRWVDDRVWLVSDNAAVGTDSSSWGPVPGTDVVGVVTIVLDRALTGDLGPPVA